MGEFKIEITATGGHGCQREYKDGAQIFGCGFMSCPDCMTREFLGHLRAKGVGILSAEFKHWPGTPEEVVDDLVVLTRKGSFPD